MTDERENKPGCRIGGSLVHFWDSEGQNNMLHVGRTWSSRMAKHEVTELHDRDVTHASPTAARPTQRKEMSQRK